MSAENQSPRIDPVELEHTANGYLCPMGASIVVCDMSDPHNQRFLRGHDATVSAACLSRSNALVASGQMMSSTSTTQEAPIIVWDFETGEQIYNFFGIHEEVLEVSFSPDDRFLCASGSDGMMFIWDMSSGEQVFARKFPSEVRAITWDQPKGEGRRLKYSISFAAASDVYNGLLEYDVRSMKYVLRTSSYHMPASGFSRSYTSGTFMGEGEFFIIGTMAGELAVFNCEAQVFRACIPLCSNGVRTVQRGAQGTVLAGGGDGTLNVLYGSDTQWSIVSSIQLTAAVSACSLSADCSGVLVGTHNGCLFNVALLQDGSLGSASLIEQSHTSTIPALTFGKDRSDLFATGSEDGSVRLWDLSDYSVVHAVSCPSAVTCVALDNQDSALFVGSVDGNLRGFSLVATKPSWVLAAHRGRVNDLAVNETCFITGGDDITVNVFSRATRELLLQFIDHVKPVLRVQLDVKFAHLVHSVGKDRCLYSYDLRTERRIVKHEIAKFGSGGMTCLAQRRDSELELITGTSNGQLLFWDCDIPDPVMALRGDSESLVHSVAVSPSGKYLATASEDSFVRVFDISKQYLLSAKIAHSSAVLEVRWAPDEKQLVSVGADSCIAVWNFYGVEE